MTARVWWNLGDKIDLNRETAHKTMHEYFTANMVSRSNCTQNLLVTVFLKHLTFSVKRSPFTHRTSIEGRSPPWEKKSLHCDVFSPDHFRGDCFPQAMPPKWNTRKNPLDIFLESPVSRILHAVGFVWRNGSIYALAKTQKGNRGIRSDSPLVESIQVRILFEAHMVYTGGDAMLCEKITRLQAFPPALYLFHVPYENRTSVVFPATYVCFQDVCWNLSWIKIKVYQTFY